LNVICSPKEQIKEPEIIIPPPKKIENQCDKYKLCLSGCYRESSNNKDKFLENNSSYSGYESTWGENINECEDGCKKKWYCNG
ncbi:MAG: hypothetical protein KDK36_10930, partial [Leptospiraceae bacterium]|nr:hypothetical protein [Leptospiraceae bacterium]